MSPVEWWKIGVAAKDKRPDGTLRHSQILTSFGPGALVDLVDDAVIIAGLSWWAKGEPIQEDRLIAMLRRQEGYERVKLFAPPPVSKNLDDADRKWIKAFRFPRWFACSNERCWEEAGNMARRDGAHPRRLLYSDQLHGQGHKCKGGKGPTHKVQPVRFLRACRLGHVDDLDWPYFVHRKIKPCVGTTLWIEEAGASGDLADIRVFCSTCRNGDIRMAAAKPQRTDGETTLGLCPGKRLWLGETKGTGCKEPTRFLLRSASHAYFPVNASVIHIPDEGAKLREQVAGVLELLIKVKSPAQVELLRDMQDPVKIALEGLSDEAVFDEVVRVREKKPIAQKKVKEAELDVLCHLPPALATDHPRGTFYGRTLPLRSKKSRAMKNVDRVVLLHRLVEVRALVGFTRFEAQTADKDGEIDIGAEVAKPDEPLTWLPAVEHYGEGVFFSLDEGALQRWEKDNDAVKERAALFQDGFLLWKGQRKDRAKAKPDFITPRFVLLHSLAHLLITAVALECGYSASSIRERIYAPTVGSGILLYTASPGSEGSLGGLVEIGRHLDRYLEKALDLGRLCSNDPVCGAHVPDHEEGTSDRHLEGASCHGCLLISEPSCERMNVYLDRTLVVPTLQHRGAAFFGEG